MLTSENALLLILTCGGAVAAFDAQALYYLSPYLAADLHLSNTQLGLVSSIVVISWAISAYSVGYISDRSGKRKGYLVAAFVFFGVCSAFSGLAPSFGWLMCARLLVGLAEGPVIPISQSLMMAASSAHRRGMNMGIVQNLGAQMVGALLGPLIVVWLANAFGWRTAFYIAGAPGLLMALVIAKYIRDPPQAESTQMPASRSVTTQLGDLLKHGNLRTCIIIGCFICAWYFLLLTFLPLYCVQVLHFSGERMSVVMAANGAAGVVSAVVVPHLSDRIGRRPTLVLFALLSALAPLSVLVAGHSFQVLLALVFVGSMATGTTPLFMGTVPLETVGPRDAAAASGMILAAGSIAGGFIGPALAGVLADRFGMVAPMMLGIGMALAAAFTGLSLRETAPVRGGRVTAFT